MAKSGDCLMVQEQRDLFAPRLPEGIPSGVCTLFETLALEVHEAGWKRFSSDAILHRIRWYHHVETGDRTFKCNDHWTAALARWFLDRHPHMEGFFELRQRRVR